MKLYADFPARRTRQLLGDALLVVWVLLWIQVAAVVRTAILALARPGAQIAEAGQGLADRLRQAGATVSGLPLVGDEASGPFDGAGRAADQIAAAGTAQVQAVHDLAFWLPLCVAAVPVLLWCAAYLPLRWRFVRNATAGQRYVDSGRDLDLFALRALSRQPMHRLGRLSDDPAGAWRRADPAVVRALADLELRDAGLRPPGR